MPDKQDDNPKDDNPQEDDTDNVVEGLTDPDLMETASNCSSTTHSWPGRVLHAKEVLQNNADPVYHSLALSFAVPDNPDDIITISLGSYTSDQTLKQIYLDDKRYGFTTIKNPANKLGTIWWSVLDNWLPIITQSREALQNLFPFNHYKQLSLDYEFSDPIISWINADHQTEIFQPNNEDFANNSTGPAPSSDHLYENRISISIKFALQFLPHSVENHPRDMYSTLIANMQTLADSQDASPLLIQGSRF